MGDLERERLQTAFLVAFVERGIVRHAAMAVGVARSTVYLWCETDPAFAQLFKLASEEVCDLIRAEIWRRAVTGWIETTETIEILADGRRRTKVVTVNRYSDILLRMLAIARLPEFRERLDITSGNERLGAYVQEEARRAMEDPVYAGMISDLLAYVASREPALSLDNGERAWIPHRFIDAAPV